MTTAKKRYVPDPQAEPISLDFEQLRQFVREEVAKALASLKTELVQATLEDMVRQARLRSAAQCRREVY